ncbi:MAG: CPBP family intramembrane metalloprotease [Anaerolineales bacterium]|nr:CPBP family intramembrane metalloprotease [Anaerolineales bacterium]
MTELQQEKHHNQTKSEEWVVQNPFARFGLAVLLLLGGLLVFLFGVPYHSTFPTNGDLLYNALLSAALLLIVLLLRWRVETQSYWQSAYGLFVASFANFVMSIGIFNFIIPDSPLLQNIAFDKVAQFLSIVITILLLTKIAGRDFGSIYLQRGNLKLGLIFGLVTFIVFLVIFIIVGPLQAEETNINLDIVLSSSPWILLFIFANATMEELWYRGIFLRIYTELLWIVGAVLVTSLLFGISHVAATYVSPSQGLGFGVLVFVLGCIGAYAMHKTDSIWGSILFHAGYDLIVIIPIIASTN